MHKIIACIVAFPLFVFSVFSQDSMILRSGEEINVKVAEVGISEIKYRKSDNLTGPVYTILKNEVLLIKYENGTRDVFAAEPQKNLSTLGKGDQSCENMQSYSGNDYNRYRKLATKRIVAGSVMTGLGVPLLLGGVGFTIGGLSSFDYNGSGGPTMNFGGPALLGLGLFSTAVGAALTIVGPITLSKGIKYRKLANQSKPTLGFSPIQNKQLDLFGHAMNQQKFATIGLTF